MNELFEQELRDTSINDKTLADYVKENYIPLSVIEDIKTEIEVMDSNITEHGWRLIRKYDALQIINKHISGKEQE